MLFGYVSGLGVNRDETDLCITPEKIDIFSVPVRIRDLHPTTAAVHRLSNEEAIIVKSEDGGIVIEGITASAIYLTPNLNQMPGMRAKRLKIMIEGGEYKTFFSKDRGGWEPYIANKGRE